MPLLGSNLSGHNPSFLWATFFRKSGIKPRALTIRMPTYRRNGAADVGTTFPRAALICAKYSVTAPTTDTANDNPSGVGDFCIHFAANNVGGKPVLVTSIDVYRCTAYTDTTHFTWTKIVD